MQLGDAVLLLPKVPTSTRGKIGCWWGNPCRPGAVSVRYP